MRCKLCFKTTRSCATKKRHCWATNQQCAACHYLGLQYSQSATYIEETV